MLLGFAYQRPDICLSFMSLVENIGSVEMVWVQDFRFRIRLDKRLAFDIPHKLLC